jgi:GNAT superfamily N-acetyltransferase
MRRRSIAHSGYRGAVERALENEKCTHHYSDVYHQRRMFFADLTLSRRLESAEAYSCEQFASARKSLVPQCNSTWMKCAGATVVFDGVDAPTTQTFGLGLFEELTAAALDEMERFFFERGATVMHEVSPFAGTATLDLLCARGYRPFEISSVLFRTVETPADELPADIQVRIVANEEASLWGAISARGWTHDHPEFEEFVRDMGVLCVARQQSPCFLAELDGAPGAAGALVLHDGVAVFGGAATVPEMRRRGLQGALLHERMRYAAQHGCDLAMMVAEAGSESQRNAERKGFRVAYTRLKWRLESPSTQRN